MADRAFNEVELRRMAEHARGHRADILEGRFVIDVQHAGHVITAYFVEQP